MKAKTLARKMNARKGRPAPTLVPRYEVIGTNVDESVATLQRSDGSSFFVYTMDGTLPAVGDFVPVQSNGGDPYVMSTRMLVEGTRQSRDYQSGVSGWYIGADGNCEFNAGIFRSEITASAFRTATEGPRVEIEGGNLSTNRMVQFFTGEVAETLPGYVQSYDDATMAAVEVTSPKFSDGPTTVAVLRVGVDRTNNLTFADLIADNLNVNGVSISTPPFSMKLRTGGTAIGHDTTPGAPKAQFAAILCNTDHVVHQASAISYNAANGTWSLFRPGVYDLFANLAWDDANTNSGSREIRVVEDGNERILDSKNATLDRRTAHNIHDTIIAPTDTSLINPWTVQLKGGQHNPSASVALQITGRASIGRRSGTTYSG